MKPQNLLAGIGLICLLTPAHASETKLVFGIVPQQSASELANVWVPVMEKLSASTGVNLTFATAKDIPSFEACLATGAYDIAYMNPYHYTIFQKQNGYAAFAHEKDTRLKGLIVIHKDSGVTDIAQLAGQKIAFPSPAALAASIIPRAELKARGVPFEPAYVKSHDSVYRAVSSKLLPAGGGIMRTYANLEPDIKGQLKILYETKAYTPHAFAFSARVAEPIRQKIKTALLGMSDEALLAPLGMKGFQAAEDKDWNDVRALDLESTQTGISLEGTAAQCRFD